MTDFEKVIEFLNEEYKEKYNKFKWFKDSGGPWDVVDDLYSYCDQLEKAIDFLEDAPERIEKLEAEVGKLKSYKDVVETIARVTKDMNIIGSEK